MVGSMKDRLPILDGWRGIAVLGVLFSHYIYMRPVNLGRFGVELFFVLSGRLMAEILFVKRAELPRFFARRLSRVYPALAVYVAAISLLSIALPKGGATAAQLLSALTFTYNYADHFIGRAYALDHIWTLCVEEHTYILLGILALIARRFRLPIIATLSILAGLAMLNGAAQTMAGRDYYDVYWRTDVRGASILCGAVAYLIGRNFTDRGLERAGRLSPLVGAIGFALNLNAVPDPLKYSVGTACIAFSLATIEHSAPSVVRALSSNRLTAIGLVSYSLYLWQQPFLQFSSGLASRVSLLPFAVTAALASYFLVERPARRALNKIISLRRSSPQTAVSGI